MTNGDMGRAPRGPRGNAWGVWTSVLLLLACAALSLSISLIMMSFLGTVPGAIAGTAVTSLVAVATAATQAGDVRRRRRPLGGSVTLAVTLMTLTALLASLFADDGGSQVVAGAVASFRIACVLCLVMLVPDILVAIDGMREIGKDEGGSAVRTMPEVNPDDDGSGAGTHDDTLRDARGGRHLADDGEDYA